MINFDTSKDNTVEKIDISVIKRGYENFFNFMCPVTKQELENNKRYIDKVYPNLSNKMKGD
jgi:hypothetical protein